MSRFNRAAASRSAVSVRQHEIDLDIDEMIEADPYIDHAPGRKSERELNRVLAILDSIENREDAR